MVSDSSSQFFPALFKEGVVMIVDDFQDMEVKSYQNLFFVNETHLLNDESTLS